MYCAMQQRLLDSQRMTLNERSSKILINLSIIIKIMIRKILKSNDNNNYKIVIKTIVIISPGQTRFVADVDLKA